MWGQAVGPWGKMTSVSTKNPLDITLMQTLPSFNPSPHLTKHTSYNHLACPRNFCRHRPAISTMPSGWASNNVISVAITKRGIWFITRISFSPLDTKSVHTFMSYRVGIKQVVQVLWRFVLAMSICLNSILSSDKMEDQHLKWKQTCKIHHKAKLAPGLHCFTRIIKQSWRCSS